MPAVTGDSCLASGHLRPSLGGVLHTCMGIVKGAAGLQVQCESLLVQDSNKQAALCSRGIMLAPLSSYEAVQQACMLTASEQQCC